MHIWILLCMSTDIYVGFERGTICARWNVDYLLENLSREDHENVE